MTRYEQGFMDKCAEYGLDTGESIELMQKCAERLSARRLVEIFNNPKLVSRLRDLPRYSTTNPSQTIGNLANKLHDKSLSALRQANGMRRNNGLIGRLRNRTEIQGLLNEARSLGDKARRMVKLQETLPSSRKIPEDVLRNKEQLGALATLRDMIAQGGRPEVALKNLSIAHATYPSHSMLDLDVVRELVKTRPDLFKGFN